MKIEMPNDVKSIIKKLKDSGYKAYIVGGCVRDSLYGTVPHDWDICTSAKPEEIKKVFSDYKLVETGLKHGTVTLIGCDGQYEVTTFRIDGDYSDNRRPDSVEFTDDLIMDLSRRDFTMNAMAYNDEEGLIDPFGGSDLFGGYEKLKSGIVRCVGNANDRFNEDALRILRALRFSSTFGFIIEKETSLAIHANKDLLSNISAERVNQELCRMIVGCNRLSVLLVYSDVITTIIPELKPCIGFDQKNRYHYLTVYDHIAYAVGSLKSDDVKAALALLLHDIGKPECFSEDKTGGHFYRHEEKSAEIAEAVLRRLKFDNKSIKDITELVLYHGVQIEPTPRSVKRWLNRLGSEQFDRLLEIKLADSCAHKFVLEDDVLAKITEIKRLKDKIIAENTCFTIKNLAINGNDILSAGVPEGKRVGELLNKALDAVIEGGIQNEKSEIMRFLFEVI